MACDGRKGVFSSRSERGSCVVQMSNARIGVLQAEIIWFAIGIGRGLAKIEEPV